MTRACDSINHINGAWYHAICYLMTIDVAAKVITQDQYVLYREKFYLNYGHTLN